MFRVTIEWFERFDRRMRRTLTLIDCLWLTVCMWEEHR